MGILASLFGRAPAVGAALEVSPNTRRYEVDIDSGVLYGVPTLDDYIYGRAKIARAEALAVPAIKRARDIICGGIGQFPLVLLDPNGKPQDWSLLSQPESGIARSVTVTKTIEDMLMTERAWWKTTHLGWHGKPAEVLRLDADTITVIPQYRTFPEGQALVWPNVPGLIRIDSPNGGLLSSSQAIRTYIGLNRLSMQAIDGAPPIDWFTSAEGNEDPEDEEVTEILDDWSKMRRLRRTAFVPKDLQYHRDGFNPEQLQMAAARQDAVTDIARLTGIDAEDLSVSTTSRTYFNAQDRRRDRLESVLGPYMTAVEGRLSMEDVTPRGYKVVFDTSSYLRLDDQAAATTDETLIRSKILLPGEAREKRGLQPLDESSQDAPAELPQEVGNA